MEACPVSGSIITAGEYFDTVICWEADAVFLSMERITSGYFPAARVGGIWKLIWPADVMSRGTGRLLSVTQAPPRMFGNGADVAVASFARLAPKMDATLPGVRVGCKLAMLTTPF